jgi:transposase
VVEESLQPGAVVKAVADCHDVHPNLLHHWRRQVRQAAGRRVSFLPVSVSAGKKPSALGGAIEIELGNGVRVRVDGGVDEAALGRVLRALGR